MASTPPLFYSGSHRILRHRTANSTNPTSSASNSSCHRPGRYWNFIPFSVIKNIWKCQGLKAQSMSMTQGNVSSPRDVINVDDDPDHLLVLVHGIMGSPSDWTYFEAELKRQLGKKFLIYASSCNMYTKTFTGIDGAGKRLADEVIQVVQKTESLKKISFLAHSLGGLIARYAVAVLYAPNASSDQPDDKTDSTATSFKTSCSSNNSSIAGLDAKNFITLATPHLGVRGNKQLPFLLGFSFLEKLAAPIAPIFAGQTGGQLFLTDGKPEKPPLLLQMTSDCDDGKFISALGSFRCRILYANVAYDHMVGRRTSSIRRETELVKPPTESLDGYQHIVNMEYCPPVLSESSNFHPEAAKAKEAAQNEPTTENTIEYHEIMEEEMIHGLQRLGWIKVDVSFHSALWPFFAHNNINVRVTAKNLRYDHRLVDPVLIIPPIKQVKNEWLHNAGAGVVAHVADTIKQQEKQQNSSPYILLGS